MYHSLTNMLWGLRSYLWTRDSNVWMYLIPLHMSFASFTPSWRLRCTSEKKIRWQSIIIIFIVKNRRSYLHVHLTWHATPPHLSQYREEYGRENRWGKCILMRWIWGSGITASNGEMFSWVKILEKARKKERKRERERMRERRHNIYQNNVMASVFTVALDILEEMCLESIEWVVLWLGFS